jgi:hypothetical protein
VETATAEYVRGELKFTVCASIGEARDTIRKLKRPICISGSMRLPAGGSKRIVKDVVLALLA